MEGPLWSVPQSVPTGLAAPACPLRTSSSLPSPPRGPQPGQHPASRTLAGPGLCPPGSACPLRSECPQAGLNQRARGRCCPAAGLCTWPLGPRRARGWPRRPGSSPHICSTSCPQQELALRPEMTPGAQRGSTSRRRRTGRGESLSSRFPPAFKGLGRRKARGSRAVAKVTAARCAGPAG